MDAIPRSELRKAPFYEDTSLTGLSVDLVGDVVDVSGDIYQGYSETSRLGDVIARSSVQFRYSVKAINTGFSEVLMMVRVALLWLHHEPNGGWAALTPSYFFGGGVDPPWVGHVNDENSDNFDVLYDETFPLICPQEIPATAQSPAFVVRNLFFELKGCFSRYAGPLPSQQTDGYLYVLAAASEGGVGMPFAEIDIHIRSKYKIKPF